MAVPSRSDALAPVLDLDQATRAAPAGLGPSLPVGHRLMEFVVEREIGEGGFGIVYLARDEQLGREVAIKEYMPASLALRQPTHQVSVRSERHRESFELGLRSFLNEARLLASFDHPALVRVHRCWEDNGTAYMVMPHYRGPTLRNWLKRQPHPPDEAWLKAMMLPLMEGLAVMHADRCFHRDIAPDNILLVGPAHRPVLLDFGAARRVISDATQALTSILKPGYAPIEQYAEVSTARQGPWTDVYALCAVVYLCISSEVPVPSVGRLMKDELVPLAERARGRYSAAFLRAIDDGMAIRPEDRIPDMHALRARVLDELPGRPATARVAAAPPLAASFAAPAVGTAPTMTHTEAKALPHAAHGGTTADDTTVMILPRPAPSPRPARAVPEPPADPAPRWTWALAGAAATLLLLGGWRLIS